MSSHALPAVRLPDSSPLQPLQKSIVLHLATALLILCAGLRFYYDAPNQPSIVALEISHNNSHSNSHSNSITKTASPKRTIIAPTASDSSELEPTLAPASAAPNSAQIAAQITTEMARYLADVRQEIENRKHYPLIARTKKIEGQNTIGFTIDQFGNILNLKLVQSSGSEVLDRATLTLLETIGRFAPLPSTSNENPLTLTVPVSYQLKQ